MRTSSNFKKLAETDTVEIYAIEDRYGDRGGIMTHFKVVTDPRATLASQMAERWGLVAGESDGEDSAGRQKLRLLTPPELAKRACEASEALFKEFTERDWLVKTGSYEDAINALIAQTPPAKEKDE